MVVKVLRFVFFNLFVRPVLLIVLGLNVRHRERLPRRGPALLVANHNSHLDTMVLMGLFPYRKLHLVTPVAAADYFLSTRFMAWFSRNIIGIIPIARKREGDTGDPLQAISAALDANKIVIFFPEGSRGEPEQMVDFKSGIARLAERHPEVPVVPVFMHGLGKALPRGEALLVPFVLDIFIGEALRWDGDQQRFLDSVKSAILALANALPSRGWE